MNKFIFIGAFSILTSQYAVAARVRHLVNSYDTSTSILTGGTCYSLYSTPTRSLCGPVNSILEKKPSIRISGILKVDEKSQEFANRIISNSMDREYLERLFSESNYQDASATAGIYAAYSTWTFAYVPGHLVGAYKIINPAFPELYASAMVDAQLKLTKNFLFVSPKSSERPDFLISISPYGYDQKTFFVETTAVQIAIQENDELIKKDRYRGVDLEAAAAVFPKQYYFPQVAIGAFNLLSPQPCEPCGEKIRFLEVRDGIYRQFFASLATTFPLIVGDLNLSSRITFRENEGVDIYESPVSIAFKVGGFSSGYTISAKRYGLGFNFDTDGYGVGLQYSDEKQDDALSIERMKRTYVFLKALI